MSTVNLFRWFRRSARNQGNSTDHSAERLTAIINRFGNILERHPHSIMDVSTLPVSKNNMKVVLKVAWNLQDDESVKKSIEVGFLSLSDFQDGVGAAPISTDIPLDGKPENIEKLSVWLDWQRIVLTERAALQVEFYDFKRHQRLIYTKTP